MDIYDAFAQNSSAVSEISRRDNGRLDKISFNSKSETVEFEGETYEASEVISQLRNSDVFEETSFQTFQRSSTISKEGEVGTAYKVFAYLFALLLPIVGIGFGIYGWTKGSNHGVIVTVISAINMIAGCAMMMA